MTPDDYIERCRLVAGLNEATESGADSLIGMLQALRPNGDRLDELFAGLEQGDALVERTRQLYDVAGDDARPSGGRDAYFVIRNPQPLDPDRTGELASAWVDGVRQMALAIGQEEVAEMLAPAPSIRVLEGIPPKHPKEDAEKSHLLKTLQSKAPAMTDQIDADPLARVLRPAFYFAACDAMLRDYLMWPVYRSVFGLDDPLAPYFELWKHGVKYRVFTESQIDIYLPRQ